MTIDGSSAIYIAGFTNSPDYPVTPGAFQTACDGPDGLGAGFCNTDAFVTKLASDGSKLLYSTFLGGSLSDFGAGIAVDARGAAYITGQSNSPDFPLLNPYQSRLAGLANAFVTKLNPSGSKLEFSTYLGGSGQDGGNAIAVSPDGEVYATGYTSSTDFPLVGPFQTTNHGGFSDCFISKLSSDGHDLLKSTYFGGSGLDYPFRIALDVFGSVSVTGLTASSDLPTSHAVQDTFGGGTYDAFVLKLLPDSFRPLYSTYFGGVGDEFGYSIHSEPFGAVWFGGSTSSLNFPIRKAYQSTYAGGPFDAFLTQLSLTIPDYFRLLEDLLSGYPTLRQTAPWQDLSLMQNRFSDNNSQGAIADLQQLDLAMQNAAERNEFPSLHLQRALAVSRHLQETLRRR